MKPKKRFSYVAKLPVSLIEIESARGVTSTNGRPLTLLLRRKFRGSGRESDRKKPHRFQFSVENIKKRGCNGSFGGNAIVTDLGTGNRYRMKARTEADKNGNFVELKPY